MSGDGVQTRRGGGIAGRVILPGATIGILGGGQLGRMLALAGRQMGYRFITLDPAEDSPCGQVCDRQITARYDDLAAARELARISDCITYEFENVDAQVADVLAHEAYVPQGSQLLYTTQHRLREKRAIEHAGAQVAPYAEINDLPSLRKALADFGTPCVLKTATGGYDGKGQWVIRSEVDADAAYGELARANTELMLERFIRFDKELSVIAARSARGEIKTFPVAENIHVNNILHQTIVPARINPETARKARRLAEQIAEGMAVVGLLAVEMFLTPNGDLYVNELAPRPHNSGHFTIEACKTSQFEQHLRAICNLPLAATDLLTPVVMVNVLGQHVAPLREWMARHDGKQDNGVAVKVHIYGKHEAKENRKMGHVTLLADRLDDALAWAEQSPIWR
ncbi:MAG TPA: 5-(carboxyamino)imidazole ribonucleotide synthase [Bacilli bacterium]